MTHQETKECCSFCICNEESCESVGDCKNPSCSCHSSTTENQNTPLEIIDAHTGHKHATFKETLNCLLCKKAAIKDSIEMQQEVLTEDWEKVEELSKTLHDIYQEEAHRQEALGLGPARHYDEYEKLSEPVKEFDRVLARYIISLLAQAREETQKIGKEIEKINIENYSKIAKEQGRADMKREIVEIIETKMKGYPKIYILSLISNIT